MSEVDNHKSNSNNKGSFFINGGEKPVRINKSDLNFVKMGGHTHQYKPDFTDEWDDAIALKCTINGCGQGRMHPKQGKEFMDWLEERRAEA